METTIEVLKKNGFQKAEFHPIVWENLLAAMQDYAKQVGDVAFEAGYAYRQRCLSGYFSSTAPNKQQFIDNLFNEDVKQ